jgi:DNA-binding CsgD family transcriptional regulator
MTAVDVSDRADGPARHCGDPTGLHGLAGQRVMHEVSALRHRPRQQGGLAGRERDLAFISAFVDERAAHGGALRLFGEPGVGKSALLDAAEQEAATVDIRVLRAAGAQSENVRFCGLNQLLLPLCDDLDRLDGRQRDALNVALGFRDGPACEPLLVSNAVVALLSLVAADRPLLLVVDNLHWLDRGSAQVLGLAARRLRGSRVGLIAAERTGAARPSALEIPGHEVRPLDDHASARLLTARFPGLASQVRRRIVTEARGNPMALLELPAALTDRQRSGLAPLPAALPLSGRLRALLKARASALPATARYLLLVAALEGTGDLSLLRAAAPRQCETGDLALAERAGLVQVDEAAARVTFAYPLVRSTVLQLSASGVVRQAHLALAAQLSAQPGRRAWHLAGAAVEHGHAAAAGLTRSPRQQDEGDVGQARRLATAAYLAANVVGDLHAAEALLADARSASRGRETSAEIALATAVVLLHGDVDMAAAHRLLMRGMETMRDAEAGPLSAEEALWDLVTVCRLSGRADHRESLERFLATSGSAFTVSVRAAARSAIDPSAALGPLDTTIESLVCQADPAGIVRIASASAFGGSLQDCRQALRLVARQEAADSAGTPAMQASILLALEAYQTGQWEEAWQLAEAAGTRSADRGYQLLSHQARTVLAFVAASRGDAETARGHADEITRWAAPRGITLLLGAARYACARAALAQSDFQTAYLQAARISPVGDVSSQPFAAWAALDLVEAALRTDRHSDAVAHVEAVRQAGLAAASPRMALLSTAAMAMTAADDEAPALFDLALASEYAGRWPFDRARVRLLFGERLRRAREVTRARGCLSEAFDEFRRLGALTWAERAAMELRAAGLALPGADRCGHQVLTPQELQIARLAAAGLTNKQIAGQLFMSHRTVGCHLYRMFPKLGITSRAALGGVLPREEN